MAKLTFAEVKELFKVTEQAHDMSYKNSLTPTRSSTVYKALSHTLLLTQSAQDSEEGILFSFAKKTEAQNGLPQITSTHTQGPVTPSPVLQSLPQRGDQSSTALPLLPPPPVLCRAKRGTQVILEWSWKMLKVMARAGKGAPRKEGILCRDHTLGPQRDFTYFSSVVCHKPPLCSLSAP